MKRERCQALTGKNTRCKRHYKWVVPNTYKDKSDGVLGGKEVYLCNQHYMDKWTKERRLRLIDGGYLQPYNEHKFGSCVLPYLIEWDDIPSEIEIPKDFKWISDK